MTRLWQGLERNLFARQLSSNTSKLMMFIQYNRHHEINVYQHMSTTTAFCS